MARYLFETYLPKTTGSERYIFTTYFLEYGLGATGFIRIVKNVATRFNLFSNIAERFNPQKLSGERANSMENKAE